MAKSIRSKVKRRFRMAARQFVKEEVERKRVEEKSVLLNEIIEGFHRENIPTKNAFLYPDDGGSVFPQKEVCIPLDFRSENLPSSGYAVRFNRRKGV